MTSFHERQKNLFEHLKDAEEQYSFCKSNKVTSIPDYVIDKQTYRKVKHVMKEFRGRESIFKREEAKIRDCLRSKTIPDYIKNPRKWTYYSLSDVTAEQMSDQTNIQTALTFIREMEEKANNNIAENNEMIIDETGAVFKKPTFNVSKTIKQTQPEKPQPVIKSNKIIMPEYVIGISGKRQNANKNNKEVKSNKETKQVQLKLNHLYENEDDDDETT
ncbi:unnamed protein product [Euphydryas editha]|uniref:U5 small nuclear ribonucleoprotein TSSC4 n=1 Tax=Euphydryas editha TaxID=104508 RepID=A0AAU9TXG9_EUPED|nr:unnamed protein product [Euphydryas editha]